MQKSIPSVYANAHMNSKIPIEYPSCFAVAASPVKFTVKASCVRSCLSADKMLAGRLLPAKLAPFPSDALLLILFREVSGGVLTGV